MSFSYIRLRVQSGRFTQHIKESAYSQKRTFNSVCGSMDYPIRGRYSSDRGRQSMERRLAAILAADVVG